MTHYRFTFQPWWQNANVTSAGPKTPRGLNKELKKG